MGTSGAPWPSKVIAHAGATSKSHIERPEIAHHGALRLRCDAGRPAYLHGVALTGVMEDGVAMRSYHVDLRARVVLAYPLDLVLLDESLHLLGHPVPQLPV